MHPLANQSFLDNLESSASVGEKTGWVPHHFRLNKSFMPSYIKLHSYGEYIFDWEWAEFYERNNISYYPKLLHAIPFAPVNAPKIYGNENDFLPLIERSFEFYQTHDLSSEHYLFINDQEEENLQKVGFETQLTHQYHFHNKFDCFNHYLEALKKNKRKTITKERRAIANSDLIIEKYSKETLSDDMLERFYVFYLSTITKKKSYPYLTKEFFTSLDKNHTLLISAKKSDQTIAMALFFYNAQALYGRSWGILEEFEGQYPYLHFELCYYQGMEFCMENKLQLFEAGAQGEHKLIRGFEPVIIKSAHHIKIPQCFDIIKKDIQIRNKKTLENIEILKSYLPYK